MGHLYSYKGQMDGTSQGPTLQVQFFEGGESLDHLEFSCVSGEEDSQGNAGFGLNNEKPQINEYNALCDQIGT